MSVPYTQDQLTKVSTFAVKQLLRAENMGTFTTIAGDSWVDPLDPKMTDMLNTFKKPGNSQLYQYTTGKPITSVSQELYGTTSLWWCLLALNGYCHPDEITDGAILKVPTTAIVQSILQTANVNNIGKTITT